MKFEMLKPNKIKVTIDTKDVEELGTTFDAIVKNAPETRDIFFKLLKRAEKETGFSASNARLVVEAAIQAEKGEMTLFVTKVHDQEEKTLYDKLSEIVPEENPVKEEKSTMIELADFEDVVRMCSAMTECFWGTLYSYNDKYYMTMLPIYIPRASEFGTVCPEKYRFIVEEHGTAIVKSSAFLFIRNKFGE